MLVTVEGIDGSGKSAACDRLETAFPDAVMTREPTRGRYGRVVREAMERRDVDPLAELFLYTADHAAHLAETVEPALAEGRCVISDRFADSRYAYQGASLADRLPEPMQFVRDIHRPWTRAPDLTIYLDVPAHVGVERSGGVTKFEREPYLEDVRTNYERLIDDDPDRFVRLDATQPADEVADAAVDAIERRLG